MMSLAEMVDPLRRLHEWIRALEVTAGEGHSAASLAIVACDGMT